MPLVFSYTEAGYGHVNEDALALQQHPSDPTVWVCAVADGQGGQAGGGAAAQVAVEASVQTALSLPPRTL